MSAGKIAEWVDSADGGPDRQLALAQGGTAVNATSAANLLYQLGLTDSDGGQLAQSLRASDLTRAMRRVTAQSFGTAFDSHGLVAPTLRTVGSAAASLNDADGVYVSLTHEGSVALGHADSVAGLHIASVAQRRHDPRVVFVFRTALTDSRIWVGLASADPSLFTQLAGTDPVGGAVAIKGALWHYDYRTFNPGATGTDISATAATKTYTRVSGSWLDDGFRSGQSLTVSGFASGTNNGTKTVSAVTTADLVVSESLADEAAGASATFGQNGGATAAWKITVSDGTTQTIQTSTLATGVGISTNKRIALSVRHTGSNVWEFATYNFSTRVWENVATLTAGSGLAASDTLGVYITNTHCNAGSTTDRAISIEAVYVDAS